MANTYSLTAILCCLSLGAFSQASLTAFDAPLVIDLQTTVPGVNNGLFMADASVVSVDPAPGQLDANAWSYLEDGPTQSVLNAASVLPGIFPQGNGVRPGGEFQTGINATDVLGDRAFGIQPAGGHFTAGSLTLKVINNTGQPLQQLEVSYQLAILNDRDRANSMTLYWSATNTQGSYQVVPNTLVVSPGTADAIPEWMINDVSSFVTGMTIAVGGELFLRWLGDDVTGTGQRDEFAITNISLTAQAATAAVLTASEALISGFSHVIGVPSAPQSFEISGVNLSGPVTLEASAPYEISLSAGTGFVDELTLQTSGGTLATTAIHVRLNSASTGVHTGSVMTSSANGASVSVALSGSSLADGQSLLFINELQASNSSTILDEFGEADDWIEIYNPNPFPIDLAGWHISDNVGDPMKYTIPDTASNAVVPANGWLLIWADNQTDQGNLHTNFSLSANGEVVLLSAPDGIQVVDLIEFGPQVADESFGRQTDGGTPWVTFTIPTPGASNNLVGLFEHEHREPLYVWPNPIAESQLRLNRPVSGWIMDISGKMIRSFDRAVDLNVSDIGPGAYFIRSSDGIMLRFVKQ